QGEGSQRLRGPRQAAHASTLTRLGKGASVVGQASRLPGSQGQARRLPYGTGAGWGSSGVRRMGQIVSIVYTPEGVDPRPPDHYARVPLSVATLTPGRGIVGDRKGTGRGRQLNVMAAHTLA